MQGMASKTPPKQADARGQGAPQRAPQKGEKAKGLRGRLHDMPLAAGVAALAVCCALALPVGNLRALQNATPTAFIRQGDVQSCVSGRLTAAGNVLTAASRAGGLDEAASAVEDAVTLMREADTARDISRADQALQTQVTALAEAARAGLDAEGQTMLQRALDDFTEQGSFLRQEGRAYNTQAEEAKAVYERLPLRALFDEPDRYEGI